MKRYLILLILSIITLSLYSQNRKSFIGWLTVGAKGAVGNSILVNNNVMSDNNIKINYFSPSFNYGIKAGVGFNDRVGLYYEFMPGSFSAKYTIEDTNPYDKTLKCKTLEHVFLVRVISETGAWFEVGPKFSYAKSLSITNSLGGNYNDINESMLSSSYTSLTGGLGFSPYMGNRATVTVGIRAAYSFTDFVSDDTHQIVNDGVYDPAYDSYQSTNPLTIQFIAGFTYDIAYFGKASCGKKRIIFFK